MCIPEPPPRQSTRKIKRSQHKPRCSRTASNSGATGNASDSEDDETPTIRLPTHPTTNTVESSGHQKYLKSNEEPLDAQFKIAAESSGFEMAADSNSIAANSRWFLPPFHLSPYCNDGEVYGFGMVSLFHPVCCRIKRLTDDGLERKQIEQYVSGRARYINYII